MQTAWYQIRSGTAGVVDTLRLMKDLAIAGSVVPCVRETAARVVRGQREARQRAGCLRDWVHDVTEFLPDHTLVESLVPPTASLAQVWNQGYFQGDCDDVAVLGASLGLSIGLRARYVAVAFGTNQNAFSHVWCELSPQMREEWTAIDPTRPPNALAMVSRVMLLELM